MAELEVRVEDDALGIGPNVTISFQRTLRIPDDGNEYPLPPGLGRFPICRVGDYAAKVPANWREHGGVFIPMYQREALWLSFGGARWRPNALKVGVGKVNALTGDEWTETLSDSPQDYVVVPDQPWLDGINAGAGIIRQFVAMPLGEGYTIEGQITGKEEFGGLQLKVFEPKPGRFPEEPPPEERRVYRHAPMAAAPPPAAAPVEMGLGAGGTMRQSIYPDRHGIDTWDEDASGRVFVHIVNSVVFREITGTVPPPTPVDARVYTQYGFPWFELFDAEKGDIEESEELWRVKSVKEVDAQKGVGPQPEDETVDVDHAQVKPLGEAKVEDGSW